MIEFLAYVTAEKGKDEPGESDIAVI